MGSVRLKAKGTVHMHCAHRGIDLQFRTIHTCGLELNKEQWSRWVADGGSQVSRCWDERLQRARREGRMIHVITDYSSRHQCEFMYHLKQIQVVTHGNTYRAVHMLRLVIIHVFPLLLQQSTHSTQVMALVHSPIKGYRVPWRNG